MECKLMRKFLFLFLYLFSLPAFATTYTISDFTINNPTTDQLCGWDNTAVDGACFQIGSGLSISGGIISATGGGGGITYGGAVTTGHNNEALYIDGSGNLASNVNFTYEPMGVSNQQFFIGNGVVPHLAVNTSTSPGLYSIGAGDGTFTDGNGSYLYIDDGNQNAGLYGTYGFFGHNPLVKADFLNGTVKLGAPNGGNDTQFVLDDINKKIDMHSAVDTSRIAHVQLSDNLFSAGVKGLYVASTDDPNYFDGMVSGDFTAFGGSPDQTYVGHLDLSGGPGSFSSYSIDSGVGNYQTQVKDGSNQFRISLNPTTGLRINQQYYLPLVDGNMNDIATTDGNGNVTFQPPQSGPAPDLQTVLSVGNTNGGTTIVGADLLKADGTNVAIVYDKDNNVIIQNDSDGNPRLSAYTDTFVLNSSIGFDTGDNPISNGFSITPSIVSFTGSGLNDMTVIDKGTPSGTHSYTLTVDANNLVYIQTNLLSTLFTIGETVTDTTSGASGVIVSAEYITPDKNFVLDGVSGTFSNGDAITGGTSGFTATIQNTTITDTVTWTDMATTQNFQPLNTSTQLSHEVIVAWGATTGHTIGDQWAFSILSTSVAGLNLNYTDGIYSFADYLSAVNGNYIQVNDSTGDVTVKSFGNLVLGAGITDGNRVEHTVSDIDRSEYTSGNFNIISPVIQASGTGLFDITAGNGYTNPTDLTVVTYNIIVSSSGTPDTFDWNDSNANSGTNIPMAAGVPYTMSYRQTITWDADTGHTPGDVFEFTAQNTPGESSIIDYRGRSWSWGDLDGIGNNTLFSVNDNTQSYTLNKLGGSGSQMVTVDNEGVLGKQNIPSGSSLTSTYVGYGDVSNSLTGSTNYTYDTTGSIYQVGFPYNGVPASPFIYANFLNDGSVGLIDIGDTFGSKNGTALTISDPAQVMQFQSGSVFFLNLDVGNSLYEFGPSTGTTNNTHISLNDATGTFTFNTNAIDWLTYDKTAGAKLFDTAGNLSIDVQLGQLFDGTNVFVDWLQKKIYDVNGLLALDLSQANARRAYNSLGTEVFNWNNTQLQVSQQLRVTANIESTQSVNFIPVTYTSNHTLDGTNHVVLVDATSGNVTITLPSASGISGREYIIKRTDSSGNTVTIGATVDSTSNPTLAPNDSKTVISNNTTWFNI